MQLLIANSMEAATLAAVSLLVSIPVPLHPRATAPHGAPPEAAAPGATRNFGPADAGTGTSAGSEEPAADGGTSPAPQTPPPAPAPRAADAVDAPAALDAPASSRALPAADRAESDGGEVNPRELDQPAQEAATLYFQGRMAYDTGDFDTAIESFEKAYALCLTSSTCHAPALQYNLAKAFWKRGEVEKAADDLRRARELFTAYGKAMDAAQTPYDGQAIQANLAALDAKIEYLELEERARRAGTPQMGPTAAEIRLERRLATTRALHTSGSVLVAAGSLLAATALASLLARGATKFMLDQSGGGRPGTSNQNTPEEDRRLRNAHLQSGRVAFGTLIATAVTLPIGITLVAAARIRDKEDSVMEKELEEKRRLRSAPVAWTPGRGLLTVRF